MVLKKATKFKGKQMAKRLDIKAGSRYGNLTVIGDGKALRLPSGQTNRTILCKCDCGSTKEIRLLHLVRGRITTCGCTRHGGSGSKLHNTWRGMLNRCRNASYVNANRYIDRGITVCKEWQKYPAFEKWALSNGFKEGLTIDRINNNLGYSPDNCRFVSQFLNNCNKEKTLIIDYNGHKVPLKILVHGTELERHYHTIYGRIKRGWNPKKAVDTPIRKGNYANRWA